MPITVTDSKGKIVTGLTKDDFRLFEDAVEVPIQFFYGADTPTSTAVLFDTSASMKSRLAQSVKAMKQMFKGSDAQDEFALIEFSDRVRMTVPLTSDSDVLQQEVSKVKAHGWTALDDAIIGGIHALRGAKNRKVMFILSDGGDNNSSFEDKEVLRRLQEADVAVYSISIGRPNRQLAKFSDASGGRHLVAPNNAEIENTIAEMTKIMHDGCVLSFPTSAPRDGKYHHLVVKLKQPEGAPRLSLSYRHGYISDDDQ